MLSARNRTAGQATLRDAVLATPPQVVVGRHQHGRPRSLAGTWIAGVRRFGPLSCVSRCFGSSPATKHLATYPSQVAQSWNTTSMDPHRSSADWLASSTELAPNCTRLAPHLRRRRHIFVPFITPP
ncbi:hypothetical protein HPB52_004422 [Rhipicephalus sanguineus]|uniref:Uncharacterized protein n=1 Tax=Rhipicephalus sanguineus TaxID=34632 RepID=A0A9D4SRZ2_RHISA|nr:hypothetical protein HPB52_004422 [Rhipicephalus sanguineus]